MPENFNWGSFAGGIGGAAINAGFGLIQQKLGQIYTDYDRERNYELNEQAAENADARTRALYNDFYSTQALMKQYKEAGLSPSMMFGGTPGQGGMNGAMASGTGGPQTPFMHANMLEGAQIANLIAQTNKTKAETENIQEDTKIKDIQKRIQNLNLQEYRIEYNIASGMWQDKQGNWISAYEIATESNNYDDFLKTLRTSAEEAGQTDYIMQMSQEQGQKVLRQIYLDSNRFETEIKVLTSSGVNAKFQENIIKCLEKEGYEKQNAETALKQLQAAGENADLTKEQKSSFNNIIERLRKKNSSVADIIIVASLILNQAASTWKAPTINL